MAGADLIILSELGYYFTLPDWQHVAYKVTESMEIGSTLLAAHWTGVSEDHQISGDEVHDVLRNVPGLRLEMSAKLETFILDRWVRQ